MKPDIKIIEQFYDDSDILFKELISTVVWDERMKSRKTASFGVSYDYSGIEYPQTDMPSSIKNICSKIEKTLGFLPNNCLMNYYLNGDSTMGFHSDSSEELLEDTGVAILSLGSERHIWYRSKQDKQIKLSFLLKSGTILYMNNQVQQDWTHAILKETDIGARISLTFRHIIK